MNAFLFVISWPNLVVPQVLESVRLCNCEFSSCLSDSFLVCARVFVFMFVLAVSIVVIA